MPLGIVLVGMPTEVEGAVERYRAPGYDVVAVPLAPDARAEEALAAVRDALHALRARRPGTKAAVVGYGEGGRYAYLAVTRLDADAGAAIGGRGIGRHLDEAPRARKPLSLHFGDRDPHVSTDEVRAIKGALEGFATTEIYRYPDAATGSDGERRVLAFLSTV